MKYIYLILAILFDIIGTSSVVATNQFTKWRPILLVFISIALSFFFLSKALKSFPLSIAYSIWCGVSIVAISLTGTLFFKQKIDLASAIGILLIVAGIVVIQGFSKTAVL